MGLAVEIEDNRCRKNVTLHCFLSVQMLWQVLTTRYYTCCYVLVNEDYSFELYHDAYSINH